MPGKFMPKKLKILLSAYACEPDIGSEPGVGWNWALQLIELGNEVWVLTRLNNKKTIENKLNTIAHQNRLHFIYFDLSASLLRLKKRLGIQLYYELWQYKSYKLAQKIDFKVNFDLIHHITFGTFRHPSYFFKLNKPFIFGPVGGGEYATSQLLKNLPLKNRVFEKARVFSNIISLYRPSLRKCLDASAIILCKTEDTLRILPERHRHKAVVQTEIGINEIQHLEEKNPSSDEKTRILYAGGLLHLKGIHVAIKSIALLKTKHPNISFTIVGRGPFENYLIKLVRKLNLEDCIQFVQWLSKKELNEYYKKSDIFLFPSLHDSSGNVVLEAMSYNLPTVCLKLGGPALLLGEGATTLIDCASAKEEEIVSRLSDVLFRLCTDRKFYDDASAWSHSRVKIFSWEKAVQCCYKEIEERCFKNF
jgi:glycosyltransferase involved in cell wall biosynthesis